MKRKRNFWVADVLLVMLAVASVLSAAMLAIVKPVLLIPVGVVVLLALILALVYVQHIRRGLRRLLGGKAASESAATAGLAAVQLPVVAVSDNVIVWYNEAFRSGIAGGNDNCLLPLNKLVTGIQPAQAMQPSGQDITLTNRRFTIYGNKIAHSAGLSLYIFVDNTALKTNAEQYLLSRPSVIYFKIDTYEEILKEMRESERALIVSGIDAALERFVGKAHGLLRRISASQYVAVVEERYISKMIENRFSILDEVRKAEDDVATVSISIGVGRQGTSFKQCEEWAQQALDMALGRGGDQAAVKTADGFEFYGGVTRSVEKRTKVKSRIVATAIRELMQQFDRVLIMGHKDSDMDSLGSAVGMLRFCRICKKPAAIVINRQKTLAGSLVAHLEEEGYDKDLLMPEEALSLTGPKTLLIIVDTHIHYLLESAQIYQACGGTVVIDHHRKVVGHIDDALIFYHEPYASSASELVSELLQYAQDEKDARPTAAEAEAMLAGIMLDTRTFSLHVGVRTFEAAAWLRRMGAHTATVKRFFASSMNEYLYRSHLVSEAKVYQGCAVALSSRVPAECEVVAPQAANELLTIEGVKASFVGILVGDTVRLSARSMGDVNVQLIMEKVGGGGHLTMAGAQLKGVRLDIAQQMLFDAIASYMAERTHTK